MPLYTYTNSFSGKTVDVFQKMNDIHEYFGESGEELGWKRVFFAPNASIDTKIDPFSSRAFRERTGAKKGTVGDLLDHSKEMSNMRAEKAGGEDPVKRKYFDDYSASRKGAKHMKDRPKKLETDRVLVDYDSA